VAVRAPIVEFRVLIFPYALHLRLQSKCFRIYSLEDSMPKRRIDGTDGPSPRAGVNGFLDNHPFSALVGFSVSAATIVAGIMTYYTTERLDAAEMRHKAELLQLAANDKTALWDATNPLKQTIADLTFRLSSIERRITGTGPTYFDVSSISAGPETIKALSAKYQAFSGGDFYVAIPEMGSWSYDETTEFDFVSSIMDFVKSGGPQVRGLFGNSKLHVWRGKSEIKFQVSPNIALEHTTFTYFPAISVQKITPELVKSRLSAVDKVVNDSSDEKAHLQALAEALDQLNKELRVDEVASNSGAGNNNNKEAEERVQSNSETGIGKDVLQEVKRKDKLLDNLSSAYSGDDASFIRRLPFERNNADRGF
jgi:hypothetical protein